jgi:dihydrofolate reductase
MRRIVTSTWVTLDGFVAGPNSDMGWIGELYDDAMGAYENDLVNAVDALMLGRVTYESFAGSWPHVPDSPIASEGEKAYARRLNEMGKVVVSTTLDRAEWHNSRLLRAITPEAIEQVKREPGGDMLIYGSASVVRTLTGLGLIDEYQILVHPVLVGGGKPLFGELKDQVKLKLVNSKTHPSGVVLLTYQPRAV